MFGRLASTILRLGSSGSEESVTPASPKQAGSGEGAEEETDGERSQLFHCRSCGRVYVAVDKRSCSKCERSVGQVRSTFDAESR